MGLRDRNRKSGGDYSTEAEQEHLSSKEELDFQEVPAYPLYLLLNVCLSKIWTFA